MMCVFVCRCRLVREFVAQNNSTQIRHVIQILASEFALSQHPHSRKGGLIGLAACSIALGKVHTSLHLHKNQHYRERKSINIKIKRGCLLAFISMD